MGLPLVLTLGVRVSQLTLLGELFFLCVEAADFSDEVGLRPLRLLVCVELVLKAKPLYFFGFLCFYFIGQLLLAFEVVELLRL